MPNQYTKHLFPVRLCSIDGCTSAHESRGWCRMHYKRWQAHGDPLVALIGNDPALRFWAKVDKNGPIIVRDEHWPPNAPDPPGTPCWVWTRACDPEGYGRFGVGRKTVLAHRWAYEQECGPMPEGLETDHLCINPPCVRPSHFEAVTHLENLHRADLGSTTGAQNRAKTHCPQGHAYNDANTKIWNGSRTCRRCQLEGWYRRRGKALTAARV